MTPLLRRLSLVALWAAGPWACDSTPPPGPPAPNTPPTLSLQATAQRTVRVGQPVDFTATVEDAEDGAPVAERVLWVSSLEGQLGRGAHSRITFQQAGAHTLTATVVDSGGLSASASFPVEVLGEDAPAVRILKPAPGGAFILGAPVELECEATTAGGVPLADGAVQWRSGLTGALPAGPRVAARLLVPGADTLTCTAADPATGATTSASVDVTVSATQAPAVLITQPGSTELYVKPGEPVPYSPAVLFRATAQDFNAGGGPGSLDGDIAWTLEPGGLVLGTGPSVAHTFTTPGEYTVTARVVDGLGNPAVDTVRVRLVGNLPPHCEIDTPHDDNTRLRRDAPSALMGHCLDPETGARLEPTWTTSALDAPLGTGGHVDAVLTAGGAQVLSACAVDPEDPALRGCTERRVHAIVNTAPVDCAILRPVAGAVVNAGRAQVLEGEATDAQDPRGELRFDWVSSRDGALGRGASVPTRRLATAGSHVLTLTVTDPWGLSCTATTRVEVNGAPEVRVDEVRQGNTDCLRTTCRAGQPVMATGTVREVDTPGGIAELAWLDSLAGGMESGSGNSPGASLPFPVAGRHTLVLYAQDRAGAVGRAAVSFSVLPSGQQRLLEEVLTSDAPVVALTHGAEGLLYVDGRASAVYRARHPSGTLAVSAPAQALFTLPRPAGDVLFVATRGGGLQRCQGTACARFEHGPLDCVDGEVTAVAALESPDLLLLGTRNGLVVTRASDPSSGGPPGRLAGRRLLLGREVRQLVLSPASTASQVKAWAATSEGLAELTVRVDAPFEAALAPISVVLHRPPAIPDEDVLSVALSADGRVFAGTRKGLGIPGGAAPLLRDAPWSLPDEEVRALLFERQDSGSDVLWAGTRDGLVRYDVTRDIVTRFGVEDGLADADVHSLLKAPDGTRYIGTARGVAQYTGQ